MTTEVELNGTDYTMTVYNNDFDIMFTVFGYVTVDMIDYKSRTVSIDGFNISKVEDSDDRRLDDGFLNEDWVKSSLLDSNTIKAEIEEIENEINNDSNRGFGESFETLR